MSLVCGNTMLLEPCERDPTILAELLNEAASLEVHYNKESFIDYWLPRTVLFNNGYLLFNTGYLLQGN